MTIKRNKIEEENNNHSRIRNDMIGRFLEAIHGAPIDASGFYSPQRNRAERREEPSILKTTESARYLPACAKHTGGIVDLALSDDWTSYCRPDFKTHYSKFVISTTATGALILLLLGIYLGCSSIILSL